MARVGLAQIKLSNNPKVNFNKHVKLLRDVNADILIFPECSMIGYDVRTMSIGANDMVVASSCFVEAIGSVCKKFGKVAIVGVATLHHDKIFNSSVVIGLGDKLFKYDKRDLTEDEKGLFSPGHEKTVLSIGGIQVGLLICRDQSNDKYFKEYADYGASHIIIQAAHYYPLCEALQKREKNKDLPILRALDNRVHVAKVNSVGTLGEMISLGNSMVVDSYGNLIDSLGETEEGTLLFTI